MATKKNKRERRKARLAKRKATQRRPACGLCGKTTNLTKTECCGQWICDDEDEYVVFSFARNSCHRNHRRNTLCGFHHAEGHAGRWQDCQECRDAFETEMYVWYGTNEYNFEKLPNPPSYEPTRCHACGRVIVLSEGGYSVSGGNYFCRECTAEEVGELPSFAEAAGPAGPRVITGVFETGDLPGRMQQEEGTPGDLDELEATVPEACRGRFMELCDRTDAFCDAHLDIEYKTCCREMAAAVCRSGSPALRGRPESWAAGVVYTVGRVNFLTDPSLEPHMTSQQIAEGLGVSVGNMQSKAKIIREGLDVMPFDPAWTLESLMAENPLVWMFEFDGFLVDIRQAPREAQVAAYEQGLIPYIPADRPE
jgi:hypothetical protein